MNKPYTHYISACCPYTVTRGTTSVAAAQNFKNAVVSGTSPQCSGTTVNLSVCQICDGQTTTQQFDLNVCAPAGLAGTTGATITQTTGGTATLAFAAGANAVLTCANGVLTITNSVTGASVDNVSVIICAP